MDKTDKLTDRIAMMTCATAVAAVVRNKTGANSRGSVQPKCVADIVDVSGKRFKDGKVVAFQLDPQQIVNRNCIRIGFLPVTSCINVHTV